VSTLPAIAALALAGAWFGYSRAAKAALPAGTAPSTTPQPTGLPQIDAIVVKGQPVDMDILARTIWGEARNQGYAGMTAVANVIINRAKISARTPDQADWWGETVGEICTKRTKDAKTGKLVWQFSMWGDQNGVLAMQVTPADATFRVAQEIALRALTGLLADLTNGATNYHTTAVSPPWANPARRTAQIGAHIFYA